MESTPLAALLDPFQSTRVNGIELSIQRRGDDWELVVACRANGDTHESTSTCRERDVARELHLLLDKAIARASGELRPQVRQSAASAYASVPKELPPMVRPESVEKLSSREREVLRLVAEGDSNKKIATKLGISVHTVNAHRVSIMHKTDIHDTRGLTMFALQNGLIEQRR